MINDVCTFRITIPQSTDLNDMMYLRIEYINNAQGTLVKGPNLVNLVRSQTVRAGQTFSATKGNNLYLSFLALSSSSGDFVFRIWYKEIPGTGEKMQERVTKDTEFVDTNIRDGDSTSPTSNINNGNNSSSNS